MQRFKPFKRLLAAVLLLSSAALLPGCRQEEPAPSAPGYYTGAMKPKGSSAAKLEGVQQNNNQAAGAP